MLSSDLEKIVRRFMLLADDGIVKLLCAYVIAMRLPIPPPWLAILGSSSGGKSMLLNALAHVDGYRALDDVTSASFISGARAGAGKETSLLFDVKPNSFLVFKDFTTILSKQKEARGAIIGLLRKIYDGEMDKKTGNIAEVQHWESKIGVLLGSTSTYYTKMGEFSDMGERMLAYTFQQPDDEELGNRIFDDGLIDFEAKDVMRKAFKEYLDDSGIMLPKEVKDLPKFHPEDRKDLIDLANLTTTARSSLERDQYSRDKTVLQKHFKEKIARFLKELMALSYGFMVLNRHDFGEYSLKPTDKRILYGIALDSIPYNRRLVMVQLVRQGGTGTIDSLNQYIGIGNSGIKFALEELHAHFMVSFQKSYSGDVWILKPKWIDIVKKFEYMDTSSVQVEEEPLPPAPEETYQEQQLTENYIL